MLGFFGPASPLLDKRLFANGRDRELSELLIVYISALNFGANFTTFTARDCSDASAQIGGVNKLFLAC